MRHPIRSAALSLALCIPLAGWGRAPEQLSLQTESKLWVEGGSTIKSWSCKAGVVDAIVEASTANAVVQLLGGDKAVKTVDVTVPSEKLDCGNGTMNDHMKKALKVGDFPSVAFHVSTYDVAKSSEGIAGTLTGTLTLGGVKKTISIPATATDANGALHVVGSYELNMKDYDLTPPSLMFGRIKVRELVNVKFDLFLKS
ncbi:MAG: YceI family protein [Gemmatimonadota bacterium]